MAGQRQPFKLIQAKGRKHLTKREIAEREASEVRAEPVKKIQAPKYLPERLKKEFSQLAKELAKLELLSKLDTDVLARYVMSHGAWIQSHEKASAALFEGADEKTTGQWVRIEKTYFEQCQACANALGLTVSSRCKLVIPKKPDDPAAADPLASMFQLVTRERAEGET